jgi:hypothetical protein
MAQWSPVLTNLGHQELKERMNAMELPDPESEANRVYPSDQALELADDLNNKFPGLDWLIQQDYKGNFRITVFFNGMH